MELNLTSEKRPRFAPRFSLPRFAYVPGSAQPHPSGLESHVPVFPLSPQGPLDQEISPFLYGVDCFNAGFFWEAHEVWEQLWKLKEKHSPQSRLFQGLIALAACGVKIREKRLEGCRQHGLRAVSFFEEVAKEGPRRYGFEMSELEIFGRGLAEGSFTLIANPTPPAEFVFEKRLVPR